MRIDWPLVVAMLIGGLLGLIAAVALAAVLAP